MTEKLTPVQALSLSGKRQHLEHQRDRLRAQLAELEAKIQAFDLIMNDREFRAYVLSTSPQAGASSASGNGSSTPPTGLRAAIKGVLAEQGQPMKPVEVSGRLYDHGVGGGHDLNWLKIRVSQEMHRMYRTGKLKRLRKARYALVEAEAGVETD